MAMLNKQRVFRTEADFVLNYDMSDSENGARCLAMNILKNFMGWSEVPVLETIP